MTPDNSWADVLRQTARGQITNWADDVSDEGYDIHQSIAQARLQPSTSGIAQARLQPSTSGIAQARLQPSTSASSKRLNSVVCPDLTYAQVVEKNSTQHDCQRSGGMEYFPTNTQPHTFPIRGCFARNDDTAAQQSGETHQDTTYAQIVEIPDTKEARIDMTNVVCGEPGDPIGIRAVQSILMSATQMNLSHFHTAGMTGSVAGMQRPSPADAMNNVFTNTSMMFDSNDNVYDLRRQIVGASLKSFVTTVGGSFTVLPDRENVWYEVLNVPMYEGNILRIYIDYKKMRNHGLTLKNLADKSFGEDIMTRVSPDFMGMIDVEVHNDHISQWLARIGSLVCGTYNIQSCDKNGGHVAAVTQGSDVLAVSKIHSINKRTIQSNNVAEVEKLFGIEAAAAVLQDLTGSHIVSDFMTRTGVVLPFTKNSTEVARKGLLTAMGFERPKDDMRAAVKASIQHKSANNPSANRDAGLAISYANQSYRNPVCSTLRFAPLTVYESIMTGTEPPCNFEIITQN